MQLIQFLSDYILPVSLQVRVWHRPNAALVSPERLLSTSEQGSASAPALVGRLDQSGSGEVRLALASAANPQLVRSLTLVAGSTRWQLLTEEDGQTTRCVQTALATSEPVGVGGTLAAGCEALGEEAALLLGKVNLAEHWKVQGLLRSVEESGPLLVDGHSCKLTTYTLRTVAAEPGEEPNVTGAPAHDIKRVRVAISTVDKLPRLLVVEQVLWGNKGDTTVIAFQGVQTNPRFAPGTFVFTPPAGVPVTKRVSGGFGGGGCDVLGISNNRAVACRCYGNNVCRKEVVRALANY